MSTSPDPSIPEDPGSPFNELLGMQIIEWREDFVRMDLVIRPEHLNRSGIVHGGVLMTLIDAVCGYAGVYPGEGDTRFAVTLALNCQFIGVASGDRLIAKATRRGGGRAVFFSAGEVTDTAGTLVASGEGTYRYRTPK